jgi:hypothetical protein
VSDIYSESRRTLQNHSDTRRLADRLDEDIVHTGFINNDKTFIKRHAMFFSLRWMNEDK